MEVFALVTKFLVYAEWAILALVLFAGAVLCIGKRTRWIGASLVVAAGGYMVFLYLTPERISSSQKPLVETTFPRSMFVIPSFLVLHGYADDRTGYDVEDLLTLAETGLFRVVLAGPNLNDPILGEAVLAKAPDCAEIRAGSPGEDFSYHAKIGDLLFTARTGFERCARYVPGAVAMPQSRLDLWKQGPPGEPSTTNDGPILGVMILTLTEDGNQRVIARRVTRSRRVPVSRLGLYTYDARPEFSEISGYLQYDPDVLSFVLAATHTDQGLLPKDGAVPDTELVERAAAIVNGVTSSDKKLRAAIALAGAIHGDPVKSHAILEHAVSAFADFRQLVERRRADLLEVRVPSDCQTALQAAAGRQALAPVCEGALKISNNVWGTCIFPLVPDAFDERCTDIRKKIWDGSEHGQTTLVFGQDRGEGSSIGISDMHNSAEIRRIVVRPQAGLVNLVLVDVKGWSVVWALEGSVGCVDRVTVVGKQSGVVGVDPGRVQFRERQFVAYDHLGGDMIDFLGHAPDRTVFTAREATIIGDSGLKREPCRSREVAPSLVSPRPDQVVTRASDLAFKRQ